MFVGMIWTTVINNINGDQILENNGTTFTSATHNVHSDQMLENNVNTKDSCYIYYYLI